MGSSITRMLQGKKFAGSDCTGSSGAKNRTLATGMALTAHSIVIVSYQVLREADDYTYSGGTITFLNVVDDSEVIQVHE